MKKSFVSSATLAIIIASAITLGGHANAQYAASVVDYTAGTLVNSEWDNGALFDNPDAVLGAPQGIVSNFGYFPDNVYSVFNPHDEASALTGIGAGGQLTLQLQNYVAVSPGAFEIGVWSSVGLLDTSYPNGQAGATASALSPAASAVVSVSADGVHWVALNGGNPITFSLPGNYYANAGPYDTAAPTNPVLSDFGKPFTGSLSDFNGEDYSQILGTLNGSAGGTWLDLDSTGLSEVGYIRFNGVAAGTELDLSTISINSDLAGTAVPEPGSVALLGLGACGLAWHFKRRRAAAKGRNRLFKQTETHAPEA